MAKIKKRVVEYYHFFCPGCKYEHTYVVETDSSQWSFNGDMENPSFTPSLLNTIKVENPDTGKMEIKSICHLFLTAGKINYCGDCTHELSGKTIDLPNI